MKKKIGLVMLIFLVAGCKEQTLKAPIVKFDKKEFNMKYIAQPVMEDNQEMLEFYWTAWRLAYKHILYQDGVVQSPYMDEGLWLNTIWIWDTEFMAMYCKYAPELFPGIESLDNFYGPILDKQPSSLRIQHPDNPAFYAWIESDYFKFTNDTNRIKKLMSDKKYLARYFNWYNNLKPSDTLNFNHTKIELERKDIGFLWGSNPSGMDNTPRGRENKSNILWVDAIAQQALSALYIVRLAKEVGDTAQAQEFQTKYDNLKAIINKYYWDEKDGFYYDILESDHSFVKVKTPASYWVMLAEIPNQDQARRMMEYAKDPKVFGGKAPWVSVSRSDKDFNGEYGDYWRGSIWVPTAYIATKALEKYGYYDLADELSLNLVNHMLNTYKFYKPATIWECYNPNKFAPSFRVRKEGLEEVRPDFCGWSALAPISMVIENVLGFYDVNAQTKTVKWNKHLKGINGIRNLRFGAIITDIVANENQVKVKSNIEYTLVINNKEFKIKAGETAINL